MGFVEIYFLSFSFIRSPKHFESGIRYPGLVLTLPSGTSQLDHRTCSQPPTNRTRSFIFTTVLRFVRQHLGRAEPGSHGSLIRMVVVLVVYTADHGGEGSEARLAVPLLDLHRCKQRFLLTGRSSDHDGCMMCAIWACSAPGDSGTFALAGYYSAWLLRGRKMGGSARYMVGL